jgi:hypothetical protein
MPGSVLPCWQATNPPDDPAAISREDVATLERASNARLYVSAGVSAAVIFAAGWLLASTGDALAAQTGTGASFVASLRAVRSESGH